MDVHMKNFYRFTTQYNTTHRRKFYLGRGVPIDIGFYDTALHLILSGRHDSSCPYLYL